MNCIVMNLPWKLNWQEMQYHVELEFALAGTKIPEFGYIIIVVYLELNITIKRLFLIKMI